MKGNDRCGKSEVPWIVFILKRTAAVIISMLIGGAIHTFLSSFRLLSSSFGEWQPYVAPLNYSLLIPYLVTENLTSLLVGAFCCAMIRVLEPDSLRGSRLRTILVFIIVMTVFGLIFALRRDWLYGTEAVISAAFLFLGGFWYEALHERRMKWIVSRSLSPISNRCRWWKLRRVVLVLPVLFVLIWPASVFLSVGICLGRTWGVGFQSGSCYVSFWNEGAAASIGQANFRYTGMTNLIGESAGYGQGLVTDKNYGRSVMFPAWWFAAGAAGFGFVILRWLPLFPAGHCYRCGYNVSMGRGGLCTECGTEFRMAESGIGTD
jgi:hypothetical protein